MRLPTFEEEILRETARLARRAMELLPRMVLFKDAYDMFLEDPDGELDCYLVANKERIIVHGYAISPGQHLPLFSEKEEDGELMRERAYDLNKVLRMREILRGELVLDALAGI